MRKTVAALIIADSAGHVLRNPYIAGVELGDWWACVVDYGGQIALVFLGVCALGLLCFWARMLVYSLIMK